MARRTLAVVAVVAIVVVAAAVYFLYLTPREKTFVVKGSDYVFDVTNIPVKVGDRVKITLRNVGGTDHELLVVADKDRAINDEKARREPELAFPEAEIEDVEPGEEKSVTFTVNRAGTFYFLCLEKGGTTPLLHAEKGMIGTFIVTP